ncbi:MAG: type II secretion system protein GspD [Planctomycetes bacterium]|nr:type II secretion system protein GspD [Planctomycetota bacterium]
MKVRIEKMEKKVVKWFLVSITAVMVIILSGFGEETDVTLTEEAVVTDENVLSSFGSDVEVVFNEDEPGGVASLQSIRFIEGTTIKKGLVILGSLFRKNIVPSEKISGNITVTNLYDVSFEEALEAIIGPNKFEESKDGNFIRVFTPEEYQGRLKPYVRELYYITAEEAATLITPLLTPKIGQVTATTPALRDTEAGKSGDSLAIRDTIIIKDYKENIAEIKDALDKIDVMPPQILIEVTILEAELDETTQFGIDFDYLGVTTAIGNDGMSVAGLATSVAPSSNQSPSNTGLSIGFIRNNVTGFIRALEEATDTTVLANPKILALNKQAAKLLIGREDGYLTTTGVQDSGLVTQEVDFLESGTKLEFRPYICKGNFIRMEISPSQSNGSVVGGLPEKTMTTVMTNIMVEDGKTIVIGGLFQEKTILSRSQIPVIGDIPVIGELFRSTNDQSVRTELIILITPHIIRTPQDADGAERLEDVNRLIFKARKNISWLSRARRAEDRYAEAVRRYRAGDSDGALHQLNWIFEKTRNYLEIERLRDKIITEKFPNNTDQIERVMLGHFEREESAKWYRMLKDPVLNKDQKVTGN